MIAVRWGARLALPLLVALATSLAFAPASPAAGPYVLEVSEAIDGDGFGEVACEFKVEGFTEVEQPCEELEFETKKLIKLIPAPEPGSEFVEFKNGTGSALACNGMTKTCSFTLEADSYIEVKFDEITPSLVVKPSGEGEIECAVEGGLPELCEDEYPFETEVTLVPEPFEDWEFSSFKNGTGSASKCSGLAKPCAFILEKDSTLEASFVPSMRSLTVNKSGTGSGTVASEPAGINCGSTCSAKFAQGSKVTLKATAATGSTFTGWSGEGCTGTGTCVVTTEEAGTAVTATFTANAKPPGSGPEEPKEGRATAAPVAKVKDGKAKVKLSCSGGLCRGTLKLSARLRKGSGPIAIGRAPFVLAGGDSATVAVRLSSKARRRLTKSRILRATAGGTAIVAGTVKLKLVRP
jgi:Divergent InlB B-repeat domain